MNDYHIVPYDSTCKPSWDAFVTKSKNGTVLFYRDFMDYHSDRFTDYSLLVYKNTKLIALVPAHREGARFCSHRGLTYGGIVFAKRQRVTQLEMVFEAVISFLKDQQFSAFLLKTLPVIYQPRFGTGMAYILYKQQADLLQRDLNFVVDLQADIPTHKSKRKLLNKAYVADLKITDTTEFKPFWETVLQPVLETKYAATPVHSLEEISLLHQRFPDHIQQYTVRYQGEVIAGMTLFITNDVVKSQYGAATETGEHYKALDILYMQLFAHFKALGYRYFDLGTTTGNNGYSYNHGLSDYKEELGAFPINQDHYLLNLQ